MSETDLAEVWARALDDLNGMQIEAHQRAWLKLTRPLGLVENTALIATPNEFVKEQLETRLRTLITHALSRELGRSIQLAVTVDPSTDIGGPADSPHDNGADPGRPAHQGQSAQSRPLMPPPPGQPSLDSPGSDRHGLAEANGDGMANGQAKPPVRAAVAASRSPARRPPGSTPSTRSRRSSSGRATGSPTRRRSPWPRPPPRRTTRCSSTATRGWARPTCCTPSATTPRASTRVSRSGT